MLGLWILAAPLRRRSFDRGAAIRVDGKPRQVIGVMPKEFRFLDGEQPALFLPFSSIATR